MGVRAATLRCLIVDNNVRFGRIASLLLERGGLDVVAVVTSADDAVSRVEQLRPEVVLVDVDLGGQSGFEVARRLARERRRADVILISAYDEHEYRDLIDASPAVGFISKLELTAAAVQELVWRRGTA